MKATCPSCSTSYRVTDDKVPEGGAQIKCPKCNTLFVVRHKPGTPPPAEPAAAVQSQPAAPATDLEKDLFPQVDQAFDAISQSESSKHAQSTPLEALTGEPAPAPTYPGSRPDDPPAGNPESSVTPNLDALDGERFVSVAKPSDVAREKAKSPASKPVVRARGVSAIRAQSGARAKTGMLESYRVRTSRGLTYDFSSSEAMLRWLSEREDLQGYEASEPGGSWVPVENLMERQASQPSKTGEIVGVSPGDPVASSISPAPVATSAGSRPERARLRPMGEQAGALLWVLSMFVMVIMLLGLAATLTRYGVVDCSAYLPLESVGIKFSESGSDDPTNDSPKIKKQESPEKVFSKALSAGKRSIRMRRFSKAALEYNRALSIHQGSLEALEGLAKSYNGLGDRDRAAVVMKKVRSIKGK